MDEARNKQQEESKEAPSPSSPAPGEEKEGKATKEGKEGEATKEGKEVEESKEAPAPSTKKRKTGEQPILDAVVGKVSNLCCFLGFRKLLSDPTITRRLGVIHTVHFHAISTFARRSSVLALAAQHTLLCARAGCAAHLASTTEPAWHRRARRQRSADRTLVRAQQAATRLATHHGTAEKSAAACRAVPQSTATPRSSTGTANVALTTATRTTSSGTLVATYVASSAMWSKGPVSTRNTVGTCSCSNEVLGSAASRPAERGRQGGQTRSKAARAEAGAQAGAAKIVQSQRHDSRR